MPRSAPPEAKSPLTCAVPNDPIEACAPPLGRDVALRGTSSTAPPSAPAPSCAPRPPRLTIIRSSSAAGRVARSIEPPPGPCRGIPSRRISDSSALAPRSERLADCPGAPDWCTVAPGEVASTSAAERTSPLNRAMSTVVPAAPGACADPPSPPLSGRVDLRDWLPGYSGGTAPAFDRLPSRPPSGGATAADFSCRRGCTACRPLRSRPQRPQRGVAGHREVGPELVDEVAHAFRARELFQARERLLLAAFDDQLRPLLADAGQEAQLSLGGAVDVEHAGHGRLAGFLPGRFRVWRGRFCHRS